MKRKLILVSALALTGHAPTQAGDAVVIPADRLVIAAAVADLTEGEVRKVDPENKKITIRHGELKSLDMPAMTMIFRVKDPAMLDQVKVGDKVRFRADKVNGAFTVMEIEVVK
jgi:Cu(I)/Ag(I) efflux system periplasmic protein CusF